MKTAVKELYERLWETDKDKFTWIAILNDILEKEKEQIVNAYKEGCFDGGFFDEKWDEVRAKEYYNETYGGEQVGKSKQYSGQKSLLLRNTITEKT